MHSHSSHVHMVTMNLKKIQSQGFLGWNDAKCEQIHFKTVHQGHRLNWNLRFPCAHDGCIWDSLGLTTFLSQHQIFWTYGDQIWEIIVKILEYFKLQDNSDHSKNPSSSLKFLILKKERPPCRQTYYNHDILLYLELCKINSRERKPSRGHKPITVMTFYSTLNCPGSNLLQSWHSTLPRTVRD